MKSRMLTWVTAAAIVAALAFPLPLGAQAHEKEQRRYKVIDTGTLGGPTSSLGFEGERDVNNRGVLVSFADTSMLDPYPPTAS